MSRVPKWMRTLHDGMRLVDLVPVGLAMGAMFALFETAGRSQWWFLLLAPGLFGTYWTRRHVPSVGLQPMAWNEQEMVLRWGEIPPWMERVGHMAPVEGVEQPTACPADCGGDTVYRVRLEAIRQDD